MSNVLPKRVEKAEQRLALLQSAYLKDVHEVQQLALTCLTDQELRALLAGDEGVLQRYQAVWEAVVLRSLGRSVPAGEVSGELLEREIASRAASKLAKMFPDEGEYRRELYPKHMEFFRAGRDHREVGFIAANRCGKSEAGAYQTALHLTGLYPAWWEGKRFDHPIKAWMMSDTSQTTRDILQAKLLGKAWPGRKDQTGLDTGMIPAGRIVEVQAKPSMPGVIETALIRHISGGVSRVTFKSYQQGRKAFQGTELDLIVCDEEPPMDVYTESLMRTMDTTGTRRALVLLLFTPLRGHSEVVESFLNPEKSSQDRCYVQASWNDVPHLSAKEKEDLSASIPEYERDARTKGIPQLGAGAIYRIGESQIAVDPFDIPDSWPRVYALDVGWNCTAALWLAKDPKSGRLYAYDEHYFKHSDAGENARAILQRGKWTPGVVDPAASGRSQADGTRLIAQYRELGLKLIPARNAVEVGLSKVQILFGNNQLKILKNLACFWQEFRLYHRDERGGVVKENDHLMDCLRYAILSGQDRMCTEPAKPAPVIPKKQFSERGWMA